MIQYVRRFDFRADDIGFDAPSYLRLSQAERERAARGQALRP